MPQRFHSSIGETVLISKAIRQISLGFVRVFTYKQTSVPGDTWKLGDRMPCFSKEDFCQVTEMPQKACFVVIRCALGSEHLGLLPLTKKDYIRIR